MTPSGPVIDWLAQKWDALLAMVKAFLVFVVTIPDRVEARVSALELKIVVALVVFGVLHLIHAWITRPRSSA